jgi:hypothetical protein
MGIGKEAIRLAGGELSRLMVGENVIITVERLFMSIMAEDQNVDY